MYMKTTFPLVSIMFLRYTQSHFLDGVNLTGGIPLVLQVDHLGMVGTTGSLLSLLLLKVVDTLVELVGISLDHLV